MSAVANAANPWLAPPTAAAALDSADPIGPPLSPQPGGVSPPPPPRRLAWRTLSDDELPVALWLVSAHGGAGCSTLAALSGGWRAAGCAWPIAPPTRPARALLCARTSHTGLRAAQAALTDWTSGRVPVRLEGIVLLASAPGRLPKQLRPLLELVRGAAPGRVWEIGWQPQWQIGPPTMPTDRQLKHLYDRFGQLTTQPQEP